MSMDSKTQGMNVRHLKISPQNNCATYLHDCFYNYEDVDVSAVEQQQQNLIETVKNALNSFQLLPFSNINNRVGALLSQLTSLEVESQHEMKQMLDNQASNIHSSTEKNETKVSDEELIKKLFCADDESRKLVQLDFNKDVDTNGVIYREYLEYKEIYHYLQDLGMLKAFKDKIQLNRISIGRVGAIYKRDKHLSVSQDKQVLVHLMAAIQRYFRAIHGRDIRYYCKQISGLVLEKNVNKKDDKDKSNIKIIRATNKYIREWLTIGFEPQYEKSFFKDILVGDYVNHILFWCMFGCNSKDILDNKLTGNELVEYIKHLLTQHKWSLRMECYFSIRIAIWVAHNFIIPCIKNDDIKRLSHILTETKLGSSRHTYTSPMTCTPGLPQVHQYPQPWRVKMMVFCTALCHSAVMHSCIPPDSQVSLIVQDDVKDFINHYVPLLSRMTTLYYKYETNGSAINDNTLLEHAVNYDGSGNLLHYAVDWNLISLAEYLVVEMNFNPYLPKRVGNAYQSPHDVAKDRFLRHFRDWQTKIRKT